MSDVRRIAMWSGPRNISTAMMRSFENRADAIVVDEPFYAHYLLLTDLNHPGKDEILEAQDSNWENVVGALTGPVEEGVRVFYQKHMAHHMLPSIGHGWFDQVSHGFLIRDPREMVASYAEKREEVTPADLGLDIQKHLYEEVERRLGVSPPVILADDVLKDPDGALRGLCAALEIPFDPAMLAWPAGPRESDGIWAKHWYHAVEASTGFKPYEKKHVSLTPDLEAVAEACLPAYEWLLARRLA